MLAYAKYVTSEKWRVTSPAPAPPLITHRSPLFYLLALALFALGLMSKPMVVTLPFVLLLLDVWPLKRISDFRFPISNLPIRLLVEKIPFFALSLGGCVMTMHAQRSGGAVSPVQLSCRLMNALLTYPRYLAKIFWPSDLSIIYPYRYDWPAAALVGAAVLLLAISFLAVKFIRQSPWLFTGWFWFLGTLVPTIGIIQVGAAAMADRYTYLPSIGLLIVLVWSAAELCAARPCGKMILTLLGGSALLGCVLTTSLQISYWRDSISLFLHSLEVTENNYVTDNCLGKAFELAGDKTRALVLYREAVRLEPRYPQSQFNLATSLIGFGQMDEALQHLQAAAELEPRNPDVQFNLGIYFARHASWTNATNCFHNTLAARPGLAAAECSLAGALVHLGHFAEAAPHYRQALHLQPDLAAAKTELADLLATHPELK